jgi:predicted secreted hydrolase
MWRFLLAGVVILAVVIFGFSLIDGTGSGEVTASALLVDADIDLSQYARAIEPYDWQFPADFGAHPDFLTEWWYYTGNLSTDEGRRFGFQFTIFRRAINPADVASESEWRTGQVYLVHFTVSDIGGGEFYHAERYSRGGAGLAGATTDPRYRVWVEDWAIEAQDDEARFTQITADAGDFAVDLALEQIKPPALQGDGGLSPKSAEIGNASYYYTLSRLPAQGTIRIGDAVYQVSGNAWKDHEFSTSALGGNALGWDWFGLQFGDGRELMIGKIRLVDGGKEPAFGGLMVFEDGSTQYLPSDTFTITANDTWTSPHTGATYPSGWTISIDDIGDGSSLTFDVTPLMRDQELHSGDIAYWEGAVELSGPVSGYGYAELTGYVDAMTGRF